MMMVNTNSNIRRYPSRRNNQAQFGCGCVILAGFATVFLCIGLYASGILLPLLLQLSGARQVGTTDDLFAEVARPTVEIVGAVSQNQVVFDLGQFGRETVDTLNGSDQTVVLGTGTNGLPLATAVFNEDGLLQLCRQRSPICRNESDRFRNVQFDLRPGGAVIYVEVGAGLLWQRVGAVARLTQDGTRFELMGVDINGVTYDPASLPVFIPESSRVAILDAVEDVRRIGDDLINELALQARGETYHLESVTIDHNEIVMVLR